MPAENVHIVFGYEAGSTGAKPDFFATIDDGHGMDPEMERMVLVWGGTHRENNGIGFGRFGSGLPSARISQGRAFA